MQEPEDHRLREHKRAALAHAIGDIQGSIHANDSKSAAGLVVQGLLATAVLTLLARTGQSFDDASGEVQALIRVLLGIALVLAVASTICFVTAISPYESTKAPPRIPGKTRSLLFPDIEAMEKAADDGEKSEFDQLRDYFDAVHDDDALTHEYLRDLLEVADIRAHEAKWAQRGFVLLGAEIFAVAVYLSVLGASA